MTELETKRFEEAGSKYYSGRRVEGLRQLRALIPTVTNPRDKAGLRFYEIVWLLELGEISQARDLVGDLKELTADINGCPVDTDQFDPGVTLNIMAKFAEAKLLLAEGRESDGLRVLGGLMSQFPKQLALPGLGPVRDEIPVLQGMTLGNLGRWKEALPFLKSAAPRETLKGVVAYYLGRCYYEMKNYSSAERKLAEALEIGLTPQWQACAHYVLGLTEYNLSKMEAARREFELCAKTGEPEYLDTTKIWEWLEATARALKSPSKRKIN